MLYKVTIGEDVYLGRPEEVLAFMMKAEGAPPGDATAYMQAMAARIGEHLDVEGIDTSDEVAFLDCLQEKGILQIETFEEPSQERVDPRDAVGDGPVAYGPGVNPRDVDV
ncbi:MAG: hypothetical protein QNJ90_11795 [Planctomycetota bacterium]|nr:hypothetical protein [Planctomycetota bacterium]